MWRPPEPHARHHSKKRGVFGAPCRCGWQDVQCACNGGACFCDDPHGRLPPPPPPIVLVQPPVKCCAQYHVKGDEPSCRRPGQREPFDEGWSWWN